jgi:hypothetical protein
VGRRTRKEEKEDEDGDIKTNSLFFYFDFVSHGPERVKPIPVSRGGLYFVKVITA